MADFKFPYPRPKQLSDPYNYNSPQGLARLLQKADSALDWNDLRLILGPFLPAGNYEESAYFYPLAFDRALNHEDEAFDIQTSLVWFASEHWMQIENDNAGDAIRIGLTHCLHHWNAEFKVVHFDDAQCREKGWQRNYSDLVWMSENVIEFLNDLIRFETHADLAFSYFESLSKPSDPIKSAWFLELARSHVARDVYRLKNHRLQQILDDETLGIEHANVLREDIDIIAESPTYWRDTFAILSMPIEHNGG